MTDRFLYAVLMVCLTFGGAFAIGADLARDQAQVHAAGLHVVRLDPVVVTGKRVVPTSVAVTERTEPATRRAQ